jgi:hypothetical protein
VLTESIFRPSLPGLGTDVQRFAAEIATKREKLEH